MKWLIKLKTQLILFPFIFFHSISYANTMVMQWHDVMMDSMRVESAEKPLQIYPTVYARIAAIMSTCMYDAWTIYDPNARPTIPNGIAKQPPSPADQEKAISFAAYYCLKDQLPDRTMLSKHFMDELGYELTDTSLPAMIGTQVANVIINYRHHDGANQLGDLHPGAYSDYTNYQPVNTPTELNDVNRWQPIVFPDGSVPNFITPHWYMVKPFALTSSDQFLPEPPNLHPNRSYKNQSDQLIDISKELDDRRKMIGEYWEEEKPGSVTAGPHWNILAKHISIRDHLNLEQDIKLYFMLNNALLDASIAAWDAKRHYDYIRPMSSIRFLFKNERIRSWGGPCQGSETIRGENWLPYRKADRLVPPFPEYVSGHASFAGAGAEILKLFTKSDRFDFSVTLERGSSDIEGLAICPSRPVPNRDLTLIYRTFSEAAEDDAKSRLYMGVHFEEAAEEGLKLGRRVAREGWRKAQALFKGGCLTETCR